MDRFIPLIGRAVIGTSSRLFSQLTGMPDVVDTMIRSEAKVLGFRLESIILKRLVPEVCQGELIGNECKILTVGNPWGEIQTRT